jgi:hypothetical protein
LSRIALTGATLIGASGTSLTIALILPLVETSETSATRATLTAKTSRSALAAETALTTEAAGSPLTTLASKSAGPVLTVLTVLSLTLLAPLFHKCHHLSFLVIVELAVVIGVEALNQLLPTRLLIASARAALTSAKSLAALTTARPALATTKSLAAESLTAAEATSAAKPARSTILAVGTILPLTRPWALIAILTTATIYGASIRRPILGESAVDRQSQKSCKSGYCVLFV